MKRLSLILILILLVALSISSCSVTEVIKCPPDPEDVAGDNQENPPSSTDDGEKFTLTGVVISVSDRIEIEVINSDYASGVYWVLVSDSTQIKSTNGEKISLDSIKPGDRLDVVYGGQVMMSYPPQISAREVILK